ncbi:MAG: aminodeoxychorismate lyase [Desulfovibrionales bacterium]|nr:aminodeoxychorismate lyase [Desulfovibrionales bacterium]
MIPIGDETVFWDKIQSLSRPGEENFFAFYDHRLGAIFTNPRLMLIPLDDHLVHRGDGVFEALRFENGAIYQLDEHLHRLQRSAHAIGLHIPVQLQFLDRLIRKLCLVSKADQGNVLVFVGRGPGGFGLDVRECPSPSLYLVAKAFIPRAESFWTQGVKAVRTSIPAKQGWMSQIKSVNYLPNVLMKKDALDQGADFPLCFDEDGFLAEGSTENAVVVDEQGVFVVPELKNALVGTTLTRAMNLAQEFMSVTTRPVPESELYGCREIILLGTSIDAVSVVNYNGQCIGDGQPGPVSRRLRALLMEDRKQHAQPLVQA